MKESVLKSLTRLFAFVSQLHNIDQVPVSKQVLEKYLSLVVRKDKVRQYVIMYDFYQNNLREREMKTGEKQMALFSVKIVIICEQINRFLDKKQKIFVLTHLLEIISKTTGDNENSTDFIKTIALAFKIDEGLFVDCKHFIFGRLGNIKQKSNILTVSSKGAVANQKHIHKDFLNGEIVFFYIEGVDICLFQHTGQDDVLYYNDKKIELDSTYILYEGTTLKNPLMGALFYNEVLKQYLYKEKPDKVYFVADRVSFRFPNSNSGIQPFNFSEESGQLIGIMGNSGVGKSTLLNLLNGNLKPGSGKILINGYDIVEDKDKIHGIIGYIPQDDMLVEELTVFQNLYFSAKLCFKDLSKDKLVKKVTRLLRDLGLSEAKNLKVGNPLNKFISGGQRKRLNIALEIIREPNILFVDEPTSGLSSADSDIVMDLLKKQSLKGKLVVVNIHQPSSDIFKKFDKLLLLDVGGRMVYQGNPLDSLVYLKTYQQLLNAEEGECQNCGNINPEQVLQIIEAKQVNEYGDYTSDRQIKPEDWYQNYSKELEPELNPAAYLKIDLPETEFKPLNPLKQFWVFGLRNVLSKLSDKQYMLINLLEAPVLAIILGWFTKYNAGTAENPAAYVFSLNSNFPVYIFMAVVVAVFLGLMVSAEEIIKDRTVLKREAFLNLNRISYFNSKVFYLGIVLALQMLLFVLIGNHILEIKGMNFRYWLVLWVTSMVAGILGLNLSATIKSVVSIYILIPLLIVPQLLLGGAMIPYNKLHSKLATPLYVPISGDVMPSRWAYEALAVHQFKYNKYEAWLYPLDRAISEASYMQNYFLPELEGLLNETKRMVANNSRGYMLGQNLEMLCENINKLSDLRPDCKLAVRSDGFHNLTITQSQKIEAFIAKSKEHYRRKLNHAIEQRDIKLYALEEKVGGRDMLLQMKKDYTNEKLSEILMNKVETDKIIEYKNNLVQIADPVFKEPDMKFGRSHFFSPIKRLGNVSFETYWFNVFILTLFFIALYLMLVFAWLNKMLRLINRENLLWVFDDFWRGLTNMIGAGSGK